MIYIYDIWWDSWWLAWWCNFRILQNMSSSMGRIIPPTSSHGFIYNILFWYRGPSKELHGFTWFHHVLSERSSGPSNACLDGKFGFGFNSCGSGGEGHNQNWVPKYSRGLSLASSHCQEIGNCSNSLRFDRSRLETANATVCHSRSSLWMNAISICASLMPSHDSWFLPQILLWNHYSMVVYSMPELRR